MKQDNHFKKQMRLSKLISLCRFFKGETIVPNNLKRKERKCWQYEKEWAESLAESYTNRDRYVNYFKQRFNGKPIDFHLKVNMPKSLFAFFFLKSDSSCFIHEWIDVPFTLMSGTYCGNSTDELMYDFLGVKNPLL